MRSFERSLQNEMLQTRFGSVLQSSPTPEQLGSGMGELMIMWWLCVLSAAAVA